jgi:hypothetical protein
VLRVVAIGLLVGLTGMHGWAQEIPSRKENIPGLVTFSSEADKAWGDDDYCQVFFFVVPKTHKTPV